MLSGVHKHGASGPSDNTTVASIIFNIIITVFPITYKNVFTCTENNWPDEKRVLRRIFGPKAEEVKENGENYVMRSLMICTPHPLLFG